MFDAKFKLLFFDRQAVTDPVEKARLKALSKFGAYVRTRSRTSIKIKPGPSRPGQPPHAHTGFQTGELTKAGNTRVRYPFRDSILFGYDRSNDSVFVGPIFRTGSRTSPTVPESLEHGGTFAIGGVTTQRRTVRIQPRPFMAPAMEKELPKFAGLFRGAVSQG